MTLCICECSQGSDAEEQWLEKVMTYHIGQKQFPAFGVESNESESNQTETVYSRIPFTLTIHNPESSARLDHAAWCV